ncbi:hypothetical protein JCM24511_02680 [Saitozyma sp. JCM 24511]|nr:hypothetical protein JCM24511_02680 [Saitozyma sp. JCM 24511]
MAVADRSNPQTLHRRGGEEEEARQPHGNIEQARRGGHEVESKVIVNYFAHEKATPAKATPKQGTASLMAVQSKKGSAFFLRQSSAL